MAGKLAESRLRLVPAQHRPTAASPDRLEAEAGARPDLQVQRGT